MENQSAIMRYNIPKRRALFERLGGLSSVTVQNQEWRYMLQEDTRQSLAIEGYFASEEELEQADSGFHEGFPPPHRHEMRARLEQGDIRAIQDLFCQSLLPQ